MSYLKSAYLSSTCFGADPHVRSDAVHTVSLFMCSSHHLTSVSLDSLDQDPLEVVVAAGPHPHVLVLKLGVSDIDPTTQLLGAFHDSEVPLSFTVCFPRITKAFETRKFYTALSTGLHCVVFTTLAVRTNCEPMDLEDRSRYLVQRRSLWIVLRFRKLTAVTITSPFGFNLDDKTISDLAGGWPRLESLLLTTRFPVSGVTLRSLHTLARDFQKSDLRNGFYSIV
ncbi:hypothetical protein FB451DRAFT_1406382 [Mycena latifolia]|nr:hypothetical protein FB451DRAFT_1406382 [Mycena latifolia]